VAGFVRRRERGTSRRLWAASALLCAAFALAACGDIGRFQTASPAANPAKPNRTVAIFLDEAPPADTAEKAVGRKDEEIRLGAREIYVLYDEGMGTSKLRIPAAKAGTARNMNTVAKLAAMAAER